MSVAGVVLAAGASRRLGRPKQLATVGGERLLEHAVRVCVEGGLSPILVVLGANAKEIETACDLRRALVVHNAEWEEGAASSIRAAVRLLEPTRVDAAVVMTCDMPFVDGAHLIALVELAKREKSDTASWYDQGRGVPACYLRRSFPDLLSLQGDTGGRKLLAGVPVVELFNGRDVDTEEDLKASERDYANIGR